MGQHLVHALSPEVGQPKHHFGYISTVSLDLLPSIPH